MGKILKYLGEVRGTVAIIVVLLIIQALCDLALPQYTSDIVDVGIQQGGIDETSPDKIRKDSLDMLELFMTDEEKARVNEAYTSDDKGVYVRREMTGDEEEALGRDFQIPMAIMLQMQMSGKSDTSSASQNMDSGSAAASGSATAAGMPSSGQMSAEQFAAAVKAGAVTSEQLLAIRDEAEKEMGAVSESMLSQMAVQYIKGEYQALGMDVDQIQKDYLFRTGAMMLGVTLLMVVVAILAGLMAARASARIGMSLRDKVFKNVVSFSNTEMNHFSTASLITRSTNDIQQIQMVSVMLLRMVLYAPILGIGGVIKVVNTKTGMGWIIGVAVGLILALVLILVKVAMPKFKKMQTLVDKLNLVSREILTGILVIRAFSREKHEEKRFEEANQELKSTQLFTNRVMTFMMPIMMLIMNSITVLIVWMGAKGIDLGNLQVGDMMAFITYTMQIVMSFLMLTMVSIMLPRAGVAAERIDEVIETKSSIEDKAQPLCEDKTDWKGVLTFSDVSFRYPGASEDALEHLSFTAKPGETTAIIGSTGCGKTTLVQLIPRFYDVTGGQITIDGVDIRDLSQHKLHSLLGLVPQKAVLFSGTINSNLKFGGNTITDEETHEAARIAQAAEFIEQKGSGYESEISQGGTNVSGGQKQRLSIARAIAKRPKIYLFDDSFSALDYKTDSLLRREIAKNLSDATVILVAQRISTILHAEQIITLEEGKIAGIGTHEELMKTCEAYQEIARSQLSEQELKGGQAS